MTRHSLVDTWGQSRWTLMKPVAQPQMPKATSQLLTELAALLGAVYQYSISETIARDAAPHTQPVPPRSACGTSVQRNDRSVTGHVGPRGQRVQCQCMPTPSTSALTCGQPRVYSLGTVLVYRRQPVTCFRIRRWTT